MTTYQSDIIAQGVPAQSGVYMRIVRGTVTLANGTNLQNNDVIQLFKLSANNRLYYLALDISAALDGGAALTGTISDGTNTYQTNAGAVTRNAAASTFQAVLRTGGRMCLDSVDQTSGMLGSFAAPASDVVVQINITNNSGGAMGQQTLIRFIAMVQSE